MPGVIIQVYVESSRPCSEHRVNLISSHPKPPMERKRGYDRRAELLAYTQNLRCGKAQQSEWPFHNSIPKNNKWRWSQPFSQIRSQLFHRPSRRWWYERIVTENHYRVEGLCCGRQKMKRRNTKSKEKRQFHFCEKLKCFMRELSCARQCIGGY